MSSNGAPLVVERSTHEGPTTDENVESDAEVVGGMGKRQWTEGGGRWAVGGRREMGKVRREKGGEGIGRMG